jgi:hypothetical protein
VYSKTWKFVLYDCDNHQKAFYHFNFYFFVSSYVIINSIDSISEKQWLGIAIVFIALSYDIYSSTMEKKKEGGLLMEMD